MTRPIDEKIITMKLNNKDFVDKANETTGIIGALTRTLNKIPGVNLGKTANDLGSIRDQANKTNLSKLADSLGMVSSRFTTFGLIGVTALQNIANRAIDAGLAFSKSFTTDQVAAGFKEYELKIGSIQTILSNTKWNNTSLSDVKVSLEDLNDYADKTIYNFAQMTQNIGRFTAAGVTLGDSTVAIKGLSNLAAASGSTADQLNTAMYQMSQSMASGKMNLMDWNSLVNAGMGGKMTQDALLKTARSMGVVVDMSNGFRESISDGWLTSKVFLETLKQFGKDKSMIEAATKVRTLTQFIDTMKESIGSGWATTFENIFGDFEESTKLWSGISDEITGWIGKVSDERNKFFKEAADLGAMDNIFAGVGNAIKPILTMYQAMKEGFQRVFPPITVATFVKITETFKNFTASLAIGTAGASKLTTIFQGIFSVFSTVIEIGKRVGIMLMDLVPKGTGSGILNLLVNLAEMSIRFNQSVKDGNGLTAAITGLGNGLKKIGGFVTNAIGPIMSMAKSLKDTLGKAISYVIDLLRPVGAFLKDAFSGVGMEEILGAGTLTGGYLLFQKFGSVLEKVIGIFDTTKKGLAGLFSELGDALGSFIKQVKYDNLLKIAVSLGILAVSLKLLEGMKSEDIVKGIGALSVSLGAMLGAMAIIEKFSITGGIKASFTIIALATAVMEMAVALRIIAALDLDELGRGLMGLVGITATLALAMIAISKWGGKMKVGSLQLVALAAAILILSSAVETLSAIDTGSLVKSVAALGVIFLELGIFLKLVDRTKLNPASAVGMIAIAGAIHLIVAAISKISEIDTPNLVKGLATITIILAQMVLFSKFAQGGSMLVAGVGLMAIATALTLLMVPIGILSNMSWEELLKGLGGITVAMLAIAAASMLMSGGIVAGLGLMSMAAGLIMLMIPIKMFASMTWAEMLKGFAGLTVAMLLLAGASMLLSPAIPLMLAFGAALLVLGVSMLAAGVGVGLFAAGLAALAALTATAIASIISALGLLIVGLGSLIIDVVKFVVDLGVALLDGIDILIPKLVKVIVNLVMTLIRALDDNLPEFIKRGSRIITNLMDGMGIYIPKIVESALNMIIDVVNGMSKAIDEHGPELIDAFMILFGKITNLVIQAGISMIDALLGWIPGVKAATAKIGETAEQYIDENFRAYEVGQAKHAEFIAGLQESQADVFITAKNLGEQGVKGFSTVKTKDEGIRFGQDIITGMESKKPDIFITAKNLGDAAKTGMRDSLDTHSPSKETETIGEQTGQGLANGIESTKPEVKKAAKSVADIAKEEFDKSKEWISDRKYYNELSLTQELLAWQKIQVKYKAGTEERKEADREVYRVKQELIKEEEAAVTAQFNHSKEMIDDRKYYNQLTLNEELSSWLRVQAKYKAGTEERKEADREVYRLKKELLKADEEAVKAQFESSKSWIDDRKYYNEMSLTEELAAWEKVQARYKSGTAERKAADREVYRLKNELNTKLIELNNDYSSKIREANQRLVDDELALRNDRDSKVEEATKKSLDEELALKKDHDSKVEDANKALFDGELKYRQEYEQAVKESNDRLISEELRLTDEYNKSVEDRTKALVSFANLFDAIPEKSDVTGQQLIDNLKGQVDTFSNWSDDIETLSGRAIDDGLLAELRDMGPKAAVEIAALNSLTDEQLTEYSNLWKDKNELARAQAVGELETLRQDTYSKIEQLRADTNSQLEIYKNDWYSKTEELRKQTALQISSINADWYAKTEELRAQTSIQLSEINSEFYAKTESLRAQTAIQLEQYKNEWVSKIEELSKGTKDQFVDLSKDMKTIGADVIKGMMSGMSSMQGPLLKQATEIANAVAATMKTTLKIKSPSKITTVLGAFTGQGLANGISSQVKNVTNRSRELALAAKNSMSTLLEGFDLPEENDNEIHVKAVIDWDGFDPKDLSAGSLRIMPDTSFTTNTAAAVKPSYRQNDDKDRSENSSGSEVESKSVVVHQNLTFNSRTLSPSEAARKNLQASRQLAAQWGG